MTNRQPEWVTVARKMEARAETNKLLPAKEREEMTCLPQTMCKDSRGSGGPRLLPHTPGRTKAIWSP